MKNWTLGLLILAIAFVSCNQDNPQAANAKEKSVAEVQNQKNVKNLDVRKETTPAIPEDTVNVAKMTFTEEIFNYGTVKEGEVVEHTFKFKNSGVAPLTITSAKSTCGCTVPVFPKEPIAPGAEGEISVKFNTKNKSGNQKKPVNIVANTWPAKTTVYIDGVVEKDPNAATAKTAPGSKK